MRTNQDQFIMAIQNPPEPHLIIFKQIEITEKYSRVEQYEDVKVLECSIVIRSYRNKVIRCACKHQTTNKKETIQLSPSKFSDKVLQAIAKHSAVAGVDASAKKNYIGAAQVLADEIDSYYEKSIKTKK